MKRRPLRSTRTDTLFPYTTLFRSAGIALVPQDRPGVLLHLDQIGAVDDRGIAPVDRGEPLLAIGVGAIDRFERREDVVEVRQPRGVDWLDDVGIAPAPDAAAAGMGKAIGRAEGREGVWTDGWM